MEGSENSGIMECWKIGKLRKLPSFHYLATERSRSAIFPTMQFNSTIDIFRTLLRFTSLS